MRGVRKTSEGVLLLAVKVGFLLWWLFVFCGRYAPDSPYIIIVCVRIHGSSFLRKRGILRFVRWTHGRVVA